MFSGHPAIDCLRSFCLMKSRGFAYLAALGLASMMLNYVIVNTVVFSRSLRDAQDRLLWRDTTCPAHT